jgi:hypothetical protein
MHWEDDGSLYRWPAVSCSRSYTRHILSGSEFSMRRDFRRLCARIDDEARVFCEAQVLSPSPAAAWPCYLENTFQARGDSEWRDNNQDKRLFDIGAKSHSG